MADSAWIDDTLAHLRARRLDRNLKQYPDVGGCFTHGGEPCVSFSSNDYLGFSKHPDLLAALRSAKQAGSAASRLVGGSLSVHEELENSLSTHFQSESALVFGAGYLANLGLLSAAFRRNDLIVSDKLVHASVIDGIRLSRAKHERFKHNDANDLERLLSREGKHRSAGARIGVVTESVFSMDGDLAPLNDLEILCQSYDAELIVDEAHAVGVFGSAGRGLANSSGAATFARTITMSKSLGSFGGVVLSGSSLKNLLVNTARGFIYSTALPPASALASVAALRLLREDPNIGSRLLERAAVFRAELETAGLDTHGSQSQIVPVVLGDNSLALRVASLLEEDGIYCTAIREPSVPRGTARVRFSLSAVHSAETLRWAASRIVARVEEARAAA